MALDIPRFAIITAAISLGSLGLRALFIMLVGQRELPEKLRRALSFVPASIFTGLIVASAHPERIGVPGDPALPRILALGLAAIVAARTRSILWTIVSGIVAMWTLEAVFALALR